MDLLLKFKKYFDSKAFFLTLLFAGAIVLRIWNIGYSDYQGDEIKALFLPSEEESLYSFLFDQRKGPLQFLVTFAIKLFTDYSNEFLTRLPFALAGVFSVWFLYKFVEMHFGWKVAFIATFFYSTNGLFVALTRIVQYQSFVMLFLTMTLYFFSKSVFDEKFKKLGLYLGFIVWALCVLAHYDGLLILPFVLYIFYNHWLKYKSIKTFIMPSLIFIALLASFYIPFIFSISDATMDYWNNRLSGGTNKISSSEYLFEVYNPIYIVHFYKLFSVLGFIYLAYKFFKRENIQKYLFLLLWFAGIFIFFEGVVNLPGTHIFNYLIPLSVIMALGINFFTFNELWLKLRPLIIVGLFVLFSFIYLQSYAIYVDNRQEYPWQQEKFFIWNFHKPNAIFHLSMFGFPYYRGWEDIKTFASTQPEVEFYTTNERDSIARYYLAPSVKNGPKAGYYVFIKGPQSFTDVMSTRPGAWAEFNEPVFVKERNGQILSELYLIDPEFMKED